jgi:predicted transcriptional regulator
MGRKPRTAMAVSQRRASIAELYLQGWTQSAIAEQLGISQPAVSQHLTAIHARWRASAIRDFDEARLLELQKLDRIEREAWAGWERSQKPEQSARITGQGGSERSVKYVRNQFGDPRFLEQIQKCIASRRALLGLDAPTRIAPVMPDGIEPYEIAVQELSDEELRLLSRLRQRVIDVTPKAPHE